jgi:MoxR-like ATPase
MDLHRDTLTKIASLQRNVEEVIKGKAQVIRLAIITLLVRGHLLIEDVPGVGKTTLAHGLARSINCSFRRIQFTSDMLPSDILGVSIYNPAQQNFEFKPGPIFANVVLADEINRTPPKTQSALLEAMNEFQITLDKKTYPLPTPFVVMATQNPLEYQGTFPLPESQLDRFMMRIRIGYPDVEDEKNILRTQWPNSHLDHLTPVLSVQDIIRLHEAAHAIAVDESLVDYILRIVRETREAESLDVGVSPRGSLFLLKASKARALVQGRNYCIPDDIKEMAIPVLAHRVVLKSGFDGLSRGSDNSERIIRDIVEKIPVPL